MKRYELKVTGKTKTSDDHMNKFRMDNIFDVITVIRNKEGDSLVLKNTKDFDIYFEQDKKKQ